MLSTRINERWELLLPEHRAARPEWPHWERERLASMALNVMPGDLVIDVGAEEGDMPALYATWGAELIMLEPNPRVWPNIRAIWQANDLPPPVAWHVGFAGHERRNVPRWDHEYAKVMDDGWPACAHGDVIGDHGFLNLWERPDCPVITLDEFVIGRTTKSYPQIVVTIDVEGAELQVLRGALGLLTGARPLVWVAIHPIFMREGYGQRSTELHKYMRELDYDGHYITGSHEEHWLFLPR